MICDNCENSNYIRTGTLSCFLPHCTKSHEILAKRYGELSNKRLNDEELAECRMIKKELDLVRIGGE
ncbi:MAG: hypothetical protein M0R51_11880 [Clostridia bacterium]|jgi:hypothetical protein|nr:hypothetical protein [Clostridia bacterium]